MADILIYNYFFLLALLSLNVVLVFFKKYRVTHFTGIIAVASAALAYVGVYLQSNHLPASDSFEKLQNVILILTGIGTAFTLFPGKRKPVYSFWYVALFLHLFVLLGKLEASSYFYMYDNTWVVLFFQFRIAAIAVFAYTFSVFLTCLISNSNDPSLFHFGRNFLLLASGIFLLGEFSGSYWALMGWGDPWRWSRGFFLANVMFLLAMLASHLPPKVNLKPRLKTVYALVPVLIILLAYIF